MSDLYYNNVSLLLHCDGTDGSKAFIDSSRVPKTVTVYGDAQIKTDQSKFGGGSAYFDGTGDYISIPNSAAFEFGSGDFTLELWVKTSSTASYGCVISRDIGTFPFGAFALLINGVPGNGSIQFWCSNFSSSSALLSSATSAAINDNAWHHIALVRNGSAWALYKDGTSIASATWTGSIATLAQPLLVCAQNGYSRAIAAYIDEIRITKDVARYTANFTAPSEEFWQPPPPEVDEHYNNVALLLHFDGLDSSTKIIDNSPRPKGIVTVGNAQIKTAQSKFGGSSLYCDGTGDLLSTVVHPDLLLGVGSFTVEAWVYFLDSTPIILFSTILNTYGITYEFSFMAYVDHGYFYYGIRGASQSSLKLYWGTAIPLNTWTHVVIQRDSFGLWSAYKDGVKSISFQYDPLSPAQNYGPVTDIPIYNSANLNSPSPVTFLGNFGTSANCYIDDLRITVGVARYLDSFYPPSEAFYNEVYSGYTSLLLPMAGANNGVLFPDRSVVPLLTTPSGDVKTVVADYKYYGSSAYFDGTSDFIKVGTSGVPSALRLDVGDWTIEFWAKTLGNGMYAILGNLANQQGTGHWWCILNSTYLGLHTVQLGFQTGGTFRFGVAAIPANVWNHVAISKEGTNVKCFINGVQLGTTQTASAAGPGSVSSDFKIGTTADGWYPMYGYLQDVRVTQFFARYTENFTPPSAIYVTYEVSGVVRQDGVPVARTVLLIDRETNYLLGETTSDPLTGAYSFIGLLSNSEVMRVVKGSDDPLLNDLIDRIIPGES